MQSILMFKLVVGGHNECNELVENTIKLSLCIYISSVILLFSDDLRIYFFLNKAQER